MRKSLKITDKLMIEVQAGKEWLINELSKMSFRLADEKEINHFFIKTKQIIIIYEVFNMWKIHVHSLAILALKWC